MMHRLFKDLQKEFVRLLTDKEISTIYIIAPDYFRNMVIEAIPVLEQSKIQALITQNLAKRPEIVIVEAISKAKEARVF